MTRTNKIKKDNYGFSLIEILVSMMITSIIILAIGGLLSIGTRIYTSTNIETELQKESQVAINQINDIMIKAVAYKYMTVSADVDVLYVKTNREEIDDGSVDYHCYAIILDKKNQRLLFKKITNNNLAPTWANGENWAQDVADDEAISSTPSLLSQYVESLTLTPNTGPTASKDTVMITINLKLRDKNYSTFTTVKLRNN